MSHSSQNIINYQWSHIASNRFPTVESSAHSLFVGVKLFSWGLAHIKNDMWLSRALQAFTWASRNSKGIDGFFSGCKQFGDFGSIKDGNIRRPAVQNIPFFPITIFPLPLVLNSWSEVQFWDKICTLTFSSPVDVVTKHFCVHDNILTQEMRTQGLFKKIYICARTLLVLC